MEMVLSLTERRPLLRATTFSISCKRWSRFAGSTRGILPNSVEIKLRGIHIHAWETSTAAQLLRPFAWIQNVHPDTTGCADLTAFRCTAWSLDAGSIPSSKELWIVELPMVSVEDLLGKKTLIYPIDIRFSMRAVSQGVGPDHSAAPLEEDDDSGDHSRRRRLGHPSSHPRSPPRRGNHGPEPATVGGERHCRPVHERLGPAADTGGHVE
jgi:hypothetical protein